MLQRLLKHVPQSLSWELRYRIGSFPEQAPAGDVVQVLVGRNPASCLELGCGKASLLAGLRRDGWGGRYCGIDTSLTAIQEAQKRFRGDPLSRFQRGSIEHCPQDEQWDTIVLVESLYYIPIDELGRVLDRLANLVKRGGFLLFRIHDPVKYAAYVCQLIGRGAVSVSLTAYLIENYKPNTGVSTIACS